MAWETFATHEEGGSVYYDGLTDTVQIRHQATTGSLSVRCDVRSEGGYILGGVSGFSANRSSANYSVRLKVDVYVRLNSGGGTINKTFYTPETVGAPSYDYSINHAYLGDVYQKGGTFTFTYSLQQYVPLPPAGAISSISVPTLNAGTSVAISWGISSDATTYYLERSVDGGSYTSVYSGSTRSKSDIISSGWNTVRYRVRGYNVSGYSAYTYSPTMNVQYTVTFRDVSGSTLKAQTVNYGGSATAPSNPSRTGHTFAGWSGTYTNVTSNRTITATYTINSYTVSFVDHNGATLKVESVNYGGSATAPSNPSRTGHTFAGWSGSYASVTSTRTITATYTINSYTVTFVDWDGTTLKTQSVNYGSAATAPSSPSRTHYTFNGWSGSYSSITSSRTITATYSLNSYTFTFNSNRGGTPSSSSISRSYNTAIGSLPTVSRTGYTFNGWFTATSGGTKLVTTTKVTGDVTYYAQWTINTFTVTFVDWDGTTLKTQSVNYGSAATAPSNPTRTGYTFSSWSGSYSSVTSNRTITATYTINTFTVRFENYNGALIANRTVNYGDNATPPANPTRAGYDFSGWSGSYTSVTSNQTVIATYTIKSYTVRFEDYNGTLIVNRTVTHGSNATAPSNPSRTGYTFSGWSGTYTGVTSNITIVATYTIRSYTVTFVDWDGVVLKTQSVTYGSSATAPTNPTRTGHTFNGWSGTYTGITSTRTITATYTIHTFTVTFKNYDGVTLSTQTINYGSAAAPPTSPTRTGYDFSGWSGTYTNITSTRTITATFTIKTFTVTFKNWNGTTLSTQTINYGSAATAPNVPARTGYTFTGWDISFSSITSSRTVTALFKINTYTVTFVDWDGKALGSQVVDYGSNATPPSNPSRDGYTFNGWKGSYTTVTSNVTITAEYTYIPKPALTPSSISYAVEVRGGKTLSVSWGESSRATRYHLERSVNNGSYTEIYQGTARSYVDSITKGWQTVIYRVRGYNVDGYSSYRTGETREVINFPDIYENINGTWVEYEEAWVNVNGTWVEVDSIWENVNGTWIEM